MQKRRGNRAARDGRGYSENEGKPNQGEYAVLCERNKHREAEYEERCFPTVEKTHRFFRIFEKRGLTLI